MNNLLTEEQVSQQLHVSLAALRRWRLEGRGPRYIKVSALVRYRPEELEEWLASLPSGGTEEVASRTTSANR
jgi:predicted DNA-binding transcriptional regulator AlpA